MTTKKDKSANKNPRRNPQTKGPRQRSTKSTETILAENQKILDHIRNHPQDSVPQIAHEVELSRDVVQKRIDKLVALGALQKRYEVNLKSLGFINHYRMEIIVDHKALNAHYYPKPGAKSAKKTIQKSSPSPQELLAKDIMKLNDSHEDVIVEDVAVLMGDPADPSATVWTRGDQEVIFRYVTSAVRPLEGIQSSSTCIEGWSISQERNKQKTVEADPNIKQTQAVS